MRQRDEGRRELQDAIRQAYPNPQRVGCPAPDVLDRIARRAVAMQQADRDHIFHCSPCFETYLGIRNEIRRARSIWTVSTAVLAALLIGIASYFGYRILERPTQQFVSAFNLQERPIFRGPNQAALQPSPFVVPRGIVHLTMTLPLGSEPGVYQIGIFHDGQTEPLLNIAGSATIHGDGSTVLAIDLNSSKLKPGPYALGLRKDDSPWSYFPLVLR